ncbi:MAG: hypothetical protein LBN93_10805 [Candidatus Symbiothrix sp.]|jgi:hypothetical protein|nr:hypothetical protein [Candidatus Symbiothrix sp.]
MSFYKQQEYDFVCRTRTIIEQYDRLQIDEKEKFEVTLFINCLVGLLIIPQQHWYDNLPTEIISQEKWGISPNDIKKNNKDNTVNEVARHLRNSVAHYNFKVISDDVSKKIDKIKFEDFTDKTKTNKTFEETISVSNLRKFTTQLTDCMLTEMQKERS